MSGRLWGAINALLAACLCATSVLAQEAAATQAATAETAAASLAAEPAADPRIARIDALIAGTLDVTVAPQSLFDIPLTDEAALQVEALRIRTLLAAIDSAAETPDTKIAPPDPALWRGRMALDRARLAFYALDKTERDALLAKHAGRQEAAQPGETAAERQAREAELERQRSLEAARAARTEAERLVKEELARLIAVEARIAAVLGSFSREHAELATRTDALLGWQRRVREAKAAGDSEVDATYEAIRRTLRASRDELSAALDELGGAASAVPDIGPDALADIPPDVPADDARARRIGVQKAIIEARRAEQAIREERAAVLLDEITVLNTERLGLLPFLSASKRNAVTGFTPAGWEQAKLEIYQLSLILRYHRQTGTAWLAGLRSNGPSGVSIWNTAKVAIPWLLLVTLFVWEKRRSGHVIALADARLEAVDRAERRVSPSLQLQLVRFLGKIHRQLEWALFYLASLWLLPAAVQDLLEVQLLVSVIGWGIGAALAVNVINAIVAATTTNLVNVDGGSSKIRLRSLRLVARTAVIFILILVLSSRLVGQGTIYSWAFSSCWFAAFPVFLVLVRWWRSIIFERIDLVRRKTPVQVWVLSNREGWKSFLAAMIGAVQLFSAGTVKNMRLWLSDFDLARRAHAWLFRRELERFGDTHDALAVKPLRIEAMDILHPAREYTRWLESPNDELLEHIVSTARQRKGRMIALIASRGMGKSSLMHELHARVDGSVSIVCGPHTSAEAVRRAARTHDPDATTTDEPGDTAPPLMLLDEAHALAKPIIGGLALFDEVIAIARGNCTGTTWVFTIDAAVWPFLKRARDARPLFDEVHHLEPWDEAQIGALLAQRTAEAGISPVYTGLLEKLPVGADEIDRLDALKAKQGGYMRMLWDYVSGNPGLALEAWRSTLAEDGQGVVHVRPLQEPDPAMLNALPDSSLFILRAILYLTPATVEDVAQATRLSHEQVLNAFRFGQSQGIYGEQGDRVYIRWSWLRAVTRLLERRHLLVNP